MPFRAGYRLPRHRRSMVGNRSPLHPSRHRPRLLSRYRRRRTPQPSLQRTPPSSNCRHPVGTCQPHRLRGPRRIVGRCRHRRHSHHPQSRPTIPDPGRLPTPPERKIRSQSRPAPCRVAATARWARPLFMNTGHPGLTGRVSLERSKRDIAQQAGPTSPGSRNECKTGRPVEPESTAGPRRSAGPGPDLDLRQRLRSDQPWSGIQ
jgi:hypothetical protein